MALPSKFLKNVRNTSMLEKLSEYLSLFLKNKASDNNLNISAEMKSYRKLTQQKLLDSHYVSSELFETVMEAFDNIELEKFEAEPDTLFIKDENNSPDMIKDGEFTLIFSKKKIGKKIKTKTSKNPKSVEDSRQQPLPNIVG